LKAHSKLKGAGGSIVVAGGSQAARLDPSILRDAMKVLSGVAQMEDVPERQPAPREIALAYSLLADSKETVNEGNLISLVRRYLAEREKSNVEST